MENFYTTQRACPSCGSERVSRSHRRGLLERYVLSYLRFFPYRCDVCDIRFYRRIATSSGVPEASIAHPGLSKTA